MKKQILAILIISSTLIPSTGYCAYIIELNNGAQYLTGQYWEEDDQIRFRRYGGTIGLSKTFVRRVLESDLEYVDPTEIPETTDKADQAPASSEIEEGTRADEGIETGDSQPKAVDLTIYRGKRDVLMQRHESARSELKSAMKIGDRIAQQEASKKLAAIEQERARIAKEVKDKNNGVLPLWWQRGEALR